MNLRNRIAETIRRVDGDNTLSAKDLGWAIATDLIDNAGMSDLDEWDVVAIIEQNNPDKTMTAADLADAIVDELEIDD